MNKVAEIGRLELTGPFAVLKFMVVGVCKVVLALDTEGATAGEFLDIAEEVMIMLDVDSSLFLSPSEPLVVEAEDPLIDVSGVSSPLMPTLELVDTLIDGEIKSLPWFSPGPSLDVVGILLNTLDVTDTLIDAPEVIGMLIDEVVD